PAAHVAVRAEGLLPQVLDARGVLAIEQVVERVGQRLGRPRIEAFVLAQPTTPWLVWSRTNTTGPTHQVRSPVRRMAEARSATAAAGLRPTPSSAAWA